MDVAVGTMFLGLNPKIFSVILLLEILPGVVFPTVAATRQQIINHKQTVDVCFPNISCKRPCLSLQMRYNTRGFCERENHKYVSAICAVSADLEDTENASQSEDFSVTISSTNKAKELKMRVEVSGVKTQAIFDDVFSKMVADAQPIPGFRRVKGGKTPNIPRDILLEVLGPSKVYKQVIKRVINSTIAEFVGKEGLKVGKDLRVEQSFEDLEVTFEPGEEFSFDSVIQLQEMK